MLAVILHITLELLKGGPPDNRDSTLGGLLASTLLKVQMHIYTYSYTSIYMYMYMYMCVQL